MKRYFLVLVVLAIPFLVFCTDDLTTHIGFSATGLNIGLSMGVTDAVDVGIDTSMMMTPTVENKDGIFDVLVQGYVSFDTISNLSNDLSMKYSASYLHLLLSSEESTETLKFIGLTFGIEYTHWFGKSRRNGIFVGLDLPMIGYVDYDNICGFFLGPFSTEASLGVLISSLRFGYAINI